MSGGDPYGYFRAGDRSLTRAKPITTRRCLDCPAEVTGNALRCSPCRADHMDRVQKEGKRRRYQERKAAT